MFGGVMPENRGEDSDQRGDGAGVVGGVPYGVGGRPVTSVTLAES